MTYRPLSTRHLAVATAASIALLVSGCAESAPSPSGDGALSGAEIVVGSKEFTESIILGKLTQLVLEAEGATTTDRTGITGSSTVREALLSGEIDVYWDYTGTGWVNYLGHTTEDVPDGLFDVVAAEDLDTNDVAWIAQAPFENSYAVAAAQEWVGESGVESLSDAAEYVAEHPDENSICAASEFIGRDDGLPGLEAAYGSPYDEIVELDFNLIFSQVGDSCTFGEVSTTDARIDSEELVVLEDDLGFFVEYRGAVTLLQSTLDEHPEIEDALTALSEKLTDDVMRSLNARVDIDGEEPEDVAAEWLESEGLVG
ncbi:glycine betaine ABC transporter substrate-binding protein [Agromyces bauzanensis]|uniref:Glycine/betaine ABC transporter substrate-binding protein n=1 Tax=Agromyces bauzanensis TaxID=1308924 RepID=A0A917PLB5_9MICO|nr:glycine betaine ABC transporter substrate-binding protein [Agromyces bauzanensis]GGJ83442.1 glycine/betaine ABC transporter substrate-binding protein [Agromyces bauzanensis]